MSDVIEATEAIAVEPEDSVKFGGTPTNLVPGMALLIAGVLAFFMNMTDVFFAEATAWVFIIWGALLIYAGLVDIYETYEITDDALIIDNVMKPLARNRVWPWQNINRLDVVVRKKDTRLQNAKMQVYRSYEGGLSIDREDRSLDAELAAIIIERAGLKPTGAAPAKLEALPLQRNATYTWQ